MKEQKKQKQKKPQIHFLHFERNRSSSTKSFGGMIFDTQCI